MRGKIYFFIFVFIILGIVSLDLMLHDQLGNSFVRAEKDNKKNNVNGLIKMGRPTALVKPIEPVAQIPGVFEKKVSPEFLQLFNQEALEVARPQVDFEKTELRLQSWARHLNKDEINFLAEIIQNQKKNADDRALALDLLGRNQSPESLLHLKNFVLAEDTQHSTSRSRLDEELILKVQAVEEIAASAARPEAVNYLSEIQNRTEQSFIKDRVHRSLSHLKGAAASPEIQDNQALEKIID